MSILTEKLILSTHEVRPTNEIYHLVRDKKALDSITSQNMLRRGFRGKDDYVVSFTANPSIYALFIYHWKYEYRLTLNFPLLREERHLVPVYYYTEGAPPREVQRYYKRRGIRGVKHYGDNITIYKCDDCNFESEWICYHPITNLKKYLLRTERTGEKSR